MNFLALLVLQYVPLRSQGAVWGYPKRNLGEIKHNSPHKIILANVLILDGDFKQIGLQPVLGEGTDLLSDRVLVLVQVLGQALVVTKLDFHIRVKASSYIHDR